MNDVTAIKKVNMFGKDKKAPMMQTSNPKNIGFRETENNQNAD